MRFFLAKFAAVVVRPAGAAEVAAYIVGQAAQGGIEHGAGEVGGAISEARDSLALSQRQLCAANGLANERLRQVAELQRFVETERAHVMSVGVFGGLVGTMLGGGIGAAVASTREGNYGKDNEDQKEGG